MPNYAEYNASDWSITVTSPSLGTFAVTGFDEDMFSYEKDEANGEHVVGALGDVIYNKRNNKLHTLGVTLQATSPCVPNLITLGNTGEEFSVALINKSLGLRMGGSHARVTEAPAIEGSAEASPMEFNIQIADGTTENI